MTVSYSQAKVIYEGNGQTVQWDIPFAYQNKNDLQIYLLQTDGTEVRLTADFVIDTDLQVLLYPMPGSQTLPLEAGKKLMILRRTALTQQTEFEAQQAFDPFVLEEGYDKAMMIAQEQAEELARSLKFPASDTGANTDAASYLTQIQTGAAAAASAAASSEQNKTLAQTAAQTAQLAAGQAADSAQESAACVNAAEAAKTSALNSAATAVQSAQQAGQSAQTASGAASSVQSAVQTHNTDVSAHADIRTALSGKAEQTALTAHTSRTDNPHAVTKAQVGLGNVNNTADADKPVSTAVQAALDLKADKTDVSADISDINAALERKRDDEEFYPEDYGWPDIRPSAWPNAIVLLAGAKADYSAYDNLGFKATCEGGYNVFIDGVQYGDTYASGAQCSITWSQYSATAGFSITQPQALTAHIVQIVPATADNNITAFKCVRVATSGQEMQGVLWVHFNLQNAIIIQALLQDYASLYCPLCKAITAVNDLLKVTNAQGMSGQGADRYSYGAELDYCVPLDFSGASASLQSVFNMAGGNNGQLRVVRLKNITATDISSLGTNAKNLQEIKTEGVSFKPTTVTRAFLNCSQLKRLPQIDFTNTTSAFDFVKGAAALQDTVLDLGYAHLLTNFHFYNTGGLKGLLVSSQAPFSYSSAPQINISNTGLDQAALVALFNSLPQVTAGQVINITGAAGAASLTAEQLAIATDKGWTVTR